MLKNDKVRGDVRQRQFDYAQRLKSFFLVVYSPKSLGFKNEKWTENLFVYPTNSTNKFTFIWDAYRITCKICKEKNIDIITTEDPFTTGLIGYLLKKRFKRPLNVQSHVDFCDNPYWMRLRRINRFFNRLGKFVLKRADTIRVGTNFEKEKLSKKLNIPKDKIFVIPVNSEIEKFKHIDGSRVKAEYLNGRFDKMLLFTGRLVAQKDIPTLLRAFSIVVQERPRTLLMIVGSGVQGNYLQRLSNELGLNGNVVFTGSIEHNRIPEYISACDIYTISSIFEGTCIAMAEAMTADKPVVATHFAGAEDLIIEGETGFVVEQRDSVSMAKKILFLLDNPVRAEEMGRKASSRVEEIFANNRNIEKMITLWEKTAAL